MTGQGIERLLGRMEEQLSQVLKQQDEAKEHRDEQDKLIACMGRKLDAMQADMASMKPVVDQIRQARLLVVAIILVGAAFASALTLGREKLAAITNWLSS